MNRMNATEFWKNFRLGEELSVSGAFIYNGLRRFYQLRKLDNTDELFEVLYDLSVGFERLLKIAVVLLEHKDADDQAKFEKSLITHNHPNLLARVQKHVTVSLGPPHKDFVSLLARFYKQIRYGRFSLDSIAYFHRERDELCKFLARHLPDVSFPEEPSVFGIENDERFPKFIRGIVLKLSSALYEIIKKRTHELNLGTDELRHGSKAETVFLGNADIPSEDVLWKELLIFFMNTKGTSGYLKFLRGIQPLDFDPGLVDEYLDCFQSDAAKAFVMGELETHYEDLPNKGERLQMMQIIGSPNVDFSDDDDSEDDEDDFEPLME